MKRAGFDGRKRLEGLALECRPLPLNNADSSPQKKLRKGGEALAIVRLNGAPR